ncbi:MAG: hypothetical protein LC640_11505, partial [Frankia sp.]|nr:hypothetical protein [Frankia sp.]
MTDGTSNVRRLSGRANTTSATAIATRVLATLDALVQTMGEAYQREIPEYASMTPAQMTEEVLPMSRSVVTTFFDTFLADKPVEPRLLRGFESSGRARLQMGVPLESVLHAYRIAGRVTWDAIVAATLPGEEHLLAELAARWIDFIDHTSSAVARAYVHASHERLRQLDSRRRELLEALLTATDPGEVAAVSLRFSTVLSAAYVPVLVAGDGVAGRIDLLLGAAPGRTLGGHRGERVLLLVPESLDNVTPLRTAAPDALLA